MDYRDHIERFIAGEMSSSEKSWFLNELKNNPGLRQQVDFQKDVARAVAETDIIKLRDQLDIIHKTYSKDQKKSFAYPTR
jgi:hypothetical protein